MDKTVRYFKERKIKFIEYLIILLPVFIFLSNNEVLNYRKEYIYYDYGKNILRTLSRNAILFSDRADEMEFTLAYFLNVEKRREDVWFVDCNAGVSRSIYGDDYYRIWGRPRLEIRNRVEASIIKKEKDRDVYYATFLPHQTSIKKYPWGILHRVPEMRKVSFDFPAKEIYILRRPSLDKKRQKTLYLSHFDKLGEYYLFINFPGKSLKFWRILLLYSDKPVWLVSAGVKLHERGYLDDAEKFYKRALNLNPYNFESLCNLASIYERKGMLEEGIELCKKALSINPYGVSAHFNLAVIYWHQKKWSKVIEELKEVLKIEPGHVSARKYLNEAIKRINKE